MHEFELKHGLLRYIFIRTFSTQIRIPDILCLLEALPDVSSHAKVYINMDYSHMQELFVAAEYMYSVHPTIFRWN